MRMNVKITLIKILVYLQCEDSVVIANCRALVWWFHSLPRFIPFSILYNSSSWIQTKHILFQFISFNTKRVMAAGMLGLLHFSTPLGCIYWCSPVSIECQLWVILGIFSSDVFGTVLQVRFFFFTYLFIYWFCFCSNGQEDILVGDTTQNLPHAL